MSSRSAPTSFGGDSSLSESAIADDPALAAEGWERRYLADEHRAGEARELYGALGFEVLERRLEPADFGSSCGECSLAVCPTHVLIYTRRPRHRGRGPR
jgi:hypothetical protein